MLGKSLRLNCAVNRGTRGLVLDQASRSASSFTPVPVGASAAAPRAACGSCKPGGVRGIRIFSLFFFLIKARLVCLLTALVPGQL